MMAQRDTGLAEVHPDATSPRGIIAGRLNSSCVVERAVLGAVLLHPAASRELERLRQSDFVEPAHQRIFVAMVDLYDCGDVIDSVSLALRLDSSGDLTAIGGPAYLGVLAALCPAATNVRLYVNHLLEQAGERQLSSVIDELIAVRDSADDWRHKCDAAMTVGVRLYGENMRRRGPSPIGSSVEELSRQIHAAQHAAPLYSSLVSTGIIGIDRMFEQLHPGTVAYVACSTHELLSTFGLFLAESASLRTDGAVSTLFVTPCLPPAYLAAVTLSRLSGVPLPAICLDPLSSGASEDMNAAQRRLKDAPLHIVGLSELNLAGLKRQFLNHCASHGCPRLVIVDRCAAIMTQDSDFVAQLAAWSRDFGIATLCLIDSAVDSACSTPLSIAAQHRLFECSGVACLHYGGCNEVDLVVSRSPFVDQFAVALAFDPDNHRFSSASVCAALAAGGTHA